MDSPSRRARATSNLLPRRSLTLPIQQSIRERRVSSSGPPDPQVETLYYHPSTRIVAFTAGKSTTETDEVGKLPWSTRLERTIAIGQMRIYRPPGSVAFLSCGSVIKPILPKSQCWCVDEEASKFVLLIKRPQYWRIELSMLGSDAKAETEKFKNILLTILYFEKTTCPFSRGFTVELPEPPQGPIIKKPWRPVEKPKAENVSVVEILPSVEVEGADDFYSASSGNSSLYGHDEIESTDVTLKLSNFPQNLASENEDPSDSRRSRRSRKSQLTVDTSCHSEARPRARSPLRESTTSLSSSSESFHSTESWHSPLTPYPPSPSDSNPPSPLTLPKLREQNRSLTIPPETPGSWGSPFPTEIISLSSRPHTPNLVYPSDDDTRSETTASEIATPPPAPSSRCPIPSTPESKIRHRATTASPSRRRTLSPIPPPAKMFRQSQKQLQLVPRHHLQAARKIPGIVMRKTCQILLAPPSHLINLMLGLAAQISAGEWKGGWMIWGGGDGDLAFEVEEERDMVDDYGFDLRRNPSASSTRTNSSDLGRLGERVKVEIPGSWEVD